MNGSFKQIEYLLKNKAEIFNITPPNLKDEKKDKLTATQQKYQLHPQARDEFRGFDRERMKSGQSSSRQSTKWHSQDEKEERKSSEIRDSGFPEKMAGFDPFEDDFEVISSVLKLHKNSLMSLDNQFQV